MEKYIQLRMCVRSLNQWIHKGQSILDRVKIIITQTRATTTNNKYNSKVKFEFKINNK